METLPPPLAALTAAGRRDLRRAEALALGLSDSQIRRWLAAGHLSTVGPGVYLIVMPAESGDRIEQQRHAHVQRALAVVRSFPGAYLVGRSAAWAWELPLLVPPTPVELSRERRIRTERLDLLSRMPWGQGASNRRPDVQAPAEVIVEVAAMDGVEAGLMVADAALHDGVPRWKLEAAQEAFGARKGAGFVRPVCALADARIESPGESRLRWLCHRAGISLVPQVEITDERGRFIARVDFVVADTRVALEFDGMVKYATRESLQAEKLRQVALERLGYIVVRVVHADLADPKRVVALIEEAVRRDEMARSH